MSKYEYKGPNNRTCPVCAKHIEQGTPVIYFKEGAKLAEHKWCSICFTKVYLMNTSTDALMNITKSELCNMSQAALKNKYPEDYEIGGYWISTIESELMLIIDLKNVWDY